MTEIPQSINDDYWNVSFWERYMNTKRAWIVARCFPEFWEDKNEWYGKVYPNLKYTAEWARDAAYRWGQARLSDLCLLPWPDMDSHPALSLNISSPDTYVKTLRQFAIEYLKSAKPVRPNWPIRPNYTPLGDGTFYVRGARLGEQQLVGSLLRPYTPLYGRHLRWGPQLLEFKQAETSHFCVAGVTRSGKTTLLLLLAQSILSNEGRVIFFDAKSVLLSRLVRPEADPEKSFHILNPFDRRCVAWDMAADADTQHRANEVAAILFPTQANDNPYFVDASRRLATAVIEILNQVPPKKWTFLDFLLALRPANIYKTLQRHPAGRELKATYLQKGSITTENLISTLDSRLNPYMPIAAAWSKAKERLSLREWARGSRKSLLLGHSHSHQLAMSRVNRVIVRILSDALLDSQIEKPCRTFVFLDELESLGFIESLPDLLNLGAEVGVTLALGFHDLDTLKAVYGHQTEGMLAMCANMAFLRLNSRSTATWAADLLGTQEVMFPNVQVTRPPQSDSDEENPAPVSVSISHSTINRHVVSTNQLMELPLTSLASGMTGYFVSHLHPAYRGCIRGTELFPSDSLIAKYSEDKPLLWPPHSEPCFVPRPDADFEVPTNAVPSYAEDEVFSPMHPAGPFDREVDEDEVIEPNQSKEISSDGDEDDFEMRPIRLPPIKRNNQADR